MLGRLLESPEDRLERVWASRALPAEPLDHLGAEEDGPITGIGGPAPPVRRFRPSAGGARSSDQFDYNTVYDEGEPIPTEDRWFADRGEGTVYRIHNLARRTTFTPGEIGLPFPLDGFRNERRTILTNYQGARVIIDDNWRLTGTVNVGYGEWIGHTIFTLQGFPTQPERLYMRQADEEEDSDATQEGDGVDPEGSEDESEGRDEGLGESARAGGVPHTTYKAPTPDAKLKAKAYIQQVQESFENTEEGWAGVIAKGNELVRSAGGVEEAAESLWEVREECGLMNLKGVDEAKLDGLLNPDLLAYLRSVRQEGMPARYVGQRDRVKAKMHPNARRNVGQVYKQIAKDLKKLRVLAVDSNLPELKSTISSPFEAVDKMMPDRSISEEKRIVHDQRTVNAGSSKWWHPPALQPKHAQIARRIVRMKLLCPGLPVLLSKKDISGAFRLLWVKPSDVELFAGDLPWQPDKAFGQGAKPVEKPVQEDVTVLYVVSSFGFSGSPGEWTMWARATENYHRGHRPQQSRRDMRQGFDAKVLVDDCVLALGWITGLDQCGGLRRRREAAPRGQGSEPGEGWAGRGISHLPNHLGNHHGDRHREGHACGEEDPERRSSHGRARVWSRQQEPYPEAATTIQGNFDWLGSNCARFGQRAEVGRQVLGRPRRKQCYPTTCPRRRFQCLGDWGCMGRSLGIVRSVQVVGDKNGPMGPFVFHYVAEDATGQRTPCAWVPLIGKGRRSSGKRSKTWNRGLTEFLQMRRRLETLMSWSFIWERCFPSWLLHVREERTGKGRSSSTRGTTPLFGHGYKRGGAESEEVASLYVWSTWSRWDGVAGSWQGGGAPTTTLTPTSWRGAQTRNLSSFARRRTLRSSTWSPMFIRHWRTQSALGPAFFRRLWRRHGEIGGVGSDALQAEAQRLGRQLLGQAAHYGAWEWYPTRSPSSTSGRTPLLAGARWKVCHLWDRRSVLLAKDWGRWEESRLPPGVWQKRTTRCASGVDFGRDLAVARQECSGPARGLDEEVQLGSRRLSGNRCSNSHGSTPLGRLHRRTDDRWEGGPCRHGPRLGWCRLFGTNFVVVEEMEKGRFWFNHQSWWHGLWQAEHRPEPGERENSFPMVRSLVDWHAGRGLRGGERDGRDLCRRKKEVDDWEGDCGEGHREGCLKLQLERPTFQRGGQGYGRGVAWGEPDRRQSPSYRESLCQRMGQMVCMGKETTMDQWVSQPTGGCCEPWEQSLGLPGIPWMVRSFREHPSTKPVCHQECPQAHWSRWCLEWNAQDLDPPGWTWPQIHYPQTTKAWSDTGHVGLAGRKTGSTLRKWGGKCNLRRCRYGLRGNEHGLVLHVESQGVCRIERCRHGHDRQRSRLPLLQGWEPCGPRCQRGHFDLQENKSWSAGFRRIKNSPEHEQEVFVPSFSLGRDEEGMGLAVCTWTPRKWTTPFQMGIRYGLEALGDSTSSSTSSQRRGPTSWQVHVTQLEDWWGHSFVSGHGRHRACQKDGTLDFVSCTQVLRGWRHSGAKVKLQENWNGAEWLMPQM